MKIWCFQTREVCSSYLSSSFHCLRKFFSKLKIRAKVKIRSFHSLVFCQDKKDCTSLRCRTKPFHSSQQIRKLVNSGCFCCSILTPHYTPLSLTTSMQVCVNSCPAFFKVWFSFKIVVSIQHHFFSDCLIDSKFFVFIFVSAYLAAFHRFIENFTYFSGLKSFIHYFKWSICASFQFLINFFHTIRFLVLNPVCLHRNKTQRMPAIDIF